MALPGLYDCFQHWGEKNAVWVISDTHFGDKDIQKALYIIGYLTIYEENQLPFQNDSLENRIVPVPDQLSIFISLYGWSIKDF